MEMAPAAKQHPNLLTQREMEALKAVCDTLLPSVQLPRVDDEGLVEFYATSASMAGTPAVVGGLLSGGIRHPLMWLLRFALWLLSTWYGTFALCGRRSLSPEFPFFSSFAGVERGKREEVLLAWSLSSFFIFRMLFRTFKYLIAFVYFTQLKEDKTNVAWKAMDYCGPDPDVSIYNSQRAPLHGALLRMDMPRDAILQTIRSAGFRATTSSFLTVACDVVVIGSGCGGSVVAGVLAKAGHKVIIIEKGSYFPRSDLSLLEGEALSHMYECGGILPNWDLTTLFLAGSTVGGGSAVNWSASIRTPEHVRREWCDKLGLELFGREAYDRALDAVCDRMGVQTGVEEEGFNNMVLRKGCEALGMEPADVPRNAPPDHYCGWCHLGCRSGKKRSTTETWLADLADSGNGLILPGCSAVRILMHQKDRGPNQRRRVAKGVAVAFAFGGGTQEFVVESEVTVVACGALNTPGLLKRSGLKNAHIGRHLHAHPVVMAWGYFPPDKWPDNGKRNYEGGILTTMYSESHESGYGTLLQTPMLHPGMFATVTPWASAADFRERMARFSRTVHLFALVRDKGSGTVDGSEWVCYGMEEEDEGKLKVALEAAIRVLAAAGAEEVGTQHAKGERVRVVEGGVEWLARKVRKRVLRDGRTPVMSAHQMGSCRMSAEERKGAVSQSGETWEVERLYVADTSVFPTALGVNPMVTVQAIAYCTSQSILKVLQRKKQKQQQCTV
ncbi:long-chain-alcohol oxidase FAO4A-like [Zingiber officinale]|uniref:long-chain-alcohol oxidase FAO4A-like n=1 Tax=Zingiber officinale TaxID=94328 RepID=UPI001C4CCC13|nr:long-chain-alcohol oxidase FAO4A-like [Zingiber officinale]